MKLARRVDEDAEAVRTEAREKLGARPRKVTRTNLRRRATDRLWIDLEKASEPDIGRLDGVPGQGLQSGRGRFEASSVSARQLLQVPASRES